MCTVRNRLDERGVFLPLVAVIAGAVLLVVIVYGIDSSTVRKASRALEKFTEETCREVSGRAVIHQQALDNFQRIINSAVTNSTVKNVQLTRAHLIVPTMPTGGDFGFEWDTTYVPTDPHRASTGPFGMYGATQCSINCNASSCTDCVFMGDITIGQFYNSLPTPQPNQFPVPAWSNITNAGNAAACEVKGLIKTVLSGTKEISARTIWSVPVRMVPTPAAAPNLSNIPGLTMVIAPQMQVRAGDVRFRFSSMTYAYDSARREAGDPLYEYDEGGGQGSVGFDVTPRAVRYPLSVPTPTPVPPTATPTFEPTNTPPGDTPTPIPTATFTPINSPTPTPTPPWQQPQLEVHGVCRSWDGTACNSSDTGMPNEGRSAPANSAYADLPDCRTQAVPDPGVNCIIPSDREELLAACMNPGVLVRNVLTSTMLELAMRHGQLRMGTEVLAANPANRNANFNNASWNPNHPAVVVPFGQDLADRSANAYQLPYVFFHSGGDAAGNSGSTPNWAEPHGFGPVIPFGEPYHQISARTSVDLKNAVIRHHTLLSNQLRFCYHLYFGYDSFSPYEQALSRFDLPDLVNSGFEPALAGQPYSFVEALRPTPFPRMGGDVFDQECPWGATGPCSLSRTRRLNGPEVVSAMGAVQRCPIEEGGLPSGPYPTATPGAPTQWESGVYDNGICLKPSDPEDDLRGDLIGTLCYLKGDRDPSGTKCPAGFPYMSGNDFPAIKSPGLFAILDPDTERPVFDVVNGSTAYQTPVNTNTPILLVTHQPLRQQERNQIRSIIDKGWFDERPITVVFIQAWEQAGQSSYSSNNTYLKDSIIADFQSAFDIPAGEFNPENPIGPGNRDNALFVLSPYLDAPFESTAFTCTDPSDCFSKYWNTLLTSIGEDSVHTVARNIFFKRILTKGVKY